MSEEYKNKLNGLRKKLNTSRKEYEKHLKSCDHDIQKTSSEGASCVICDRNFGWWCPDSEDHICHYEGEIQLTKGEMILENGVNIEIDLSGRLLYNVDNDNCIFCGEPKRRK